MHLRPVNMHIKTQLLANGLDVLQALLIIGAGPSHPDLHFMLHKDGRHLPQRANNALEGRRDVGEVRNATANKQHFALRMHGGAQHQVQDRARVVERLRLGGGPGVFAVVGQVSHKAGGGDRIGVDDGSTAASDEGPDATIGVEDGEFERGACLCVHVRDKFFFLAKFATEGGREFHGRASVDGYFSVCPGCIWGAKGSGGAGHGPFGATFEFSGLV
ncbi:hypothetical protein I7I48_08135 [Histoplasma ohiense]|nr:hypothetical protein I7I48_08135 [Histoplasma ohiense (nom. inval.)]